MSLLTAVTPLTLRATVVALLMSLWVAAKPLSCTRPLKVSTLMSPELRPGSFNIALLTLVVTTESSMYSPVPSVFAVEAQALSRATLRASVMAAMRCVLLVMVLSL